MATWVQKTHPLFPNKHRLAHTEFFNLGKVLAARQPSELGRGRIEAAFEEKRLATRRCRLLASSAQRVMTALNSDAFADGRLV